MLQNPKLEKVQAGQYNYQTEGGLVEIEKTTMSGYQRWAAYVDGRNLAYAPSLKKMIIKLSK